MSTQTYRIFSRKAWTKTSSGFVPNSSAVKRTVARGLTLEQARRECASGPANMARKEGREYRHLPFHEFEAE